MQYVYHSVGIVDFKARPDRIIYVLVAGGKGYVVINNDSDMTEKAEIHSKETRRHTTVGRLVEQDWSKKPTPKIASGHFKGLAYPRFYDADGGALVAKEVREKKLSEKYPELYAAGGGIQEDYDSYTTINEIEIHDNPSDISKLFAPQLLTQLEHFLVPDDMARKIREYVNDANRKSQKKKL